MYTCGRALPTTLARGFTPSFFAALSVMSTRAAAPSLRVLALAAVTVPPSASTLKAGFSSGNLSKLALVGGNGERSRVKRWKKLREGGREDWRDTREEWRKGGMEVGRKGWRKREREGEDKN